MNHMYYFATFLDKYLKIRSTYSSQVIILYPSSITITNRKDLIMFVIELPRCSHFLHR